MTWIAKSKEKMTRLNMTKIAKICSYIQPICLRESTASLYEIQELSIIRGIKQMNTNMKQKTVKRRFQSPRNASLWIRTTFTASHSTRMRKQTFSTRISLLLQDKIIYSKFVQDLLNHPKPYQQLQQTIKVYLEIGSMSKMLLIRMYQIHMSLLYSN